MVFMGEVEIESVLQEEEIEDDVEEVIWAKHYSSIHEILLVGEGDFSFSLSLANAFGSAINIVATSHDSYDVLLKKYKGAKTNVEKLKEMGATVMHNVDATKMKLTVGLRTRKFDRIVFNFPHAGFKGKEEHPHMIKLHRELLRGFFRNAGHLLRPDGEVHVSHKTAAPFSHWKLEELAGENYLILIECADFSIADYPGYSNKRGDGSRSDEKFPLGKCSTFKFVIGSIHKKKVTNNYSHLLPASNHFGSYSEAVSDKSHPDLTFLASFERVNVRLPKLYGLKYKDTIPFFGAPYGLKFKDTIPFFGAPYGMNSLEFRDCAPPPPPPMLYGLEWTNTISISGAPFRMQAISDFKCRDWAPPLPSPLCSTNSLCSEKCSIVRTPYGFGYGRHPVELVSSARVSIMNCSTRMSRCLEWDEEIY